MTGARTRLLLLTAITAMLSACHGQPSPDDRALARLAVLTWSVGVLHGDTAQVNTVLDDAFTWFGNPRQRYLADLPSVADSRIVLEHARYETSGDSVLVSPVVIVEHRLVRNPLAVRLVLRRSGGRWKISAVGPADEVRNALTARELPEQRVLHRVRVAIRDEATGAPVAARVHVQDANGGYWPPEGHMKHVATAWREEVGGDVVVGGRTFAYVRPDFVLPLPAGRYEMDVVRGMEYEPRQLRFEVTASRRPALDVRLNRWSHLRARGWYAGDHHTHFLDPRAARLELEGEDLDVVSVQATKWGELITGVVHFENGPDSALPGEGVVSIGEEARHDFLGHTNLLGLRRLVYPLSWGAGGSGVPGGYDWPPVAHVADSAHAQGGFVTWAHFPFPRGELAVNVALGKLDAVDLVSWGDPFDDRAGLSSTEIWYRFLNCGFDLPAMGGTDKMWNTQVVGAVRTYASVNGPFSYRAWLAAVRAGRTFVTTGPMLSFMAGGRAIGETIAVPRGGTIPFRADVHSMIPVERLEVVMNGVVVATVENPDRRRDLVLEGSAEVAGSSWIAARATSSHVLPYQGGMQEAGIPVLAHTSPIYITVDGRPRRSAEDAAYLRQWVDEAIAWARSGARFADERQRREVIALFQRARRAYETGSARRADDR
jgi:hypothetical protein